MVHHGNMLDMALLWQPISSFVKRQSDKDIYKLLSVGFHHADKTVAKPCVCVTGTLYDDKRHSAPSHSYITTSATASRPVHGCTRLPMLTPTLHGFRKGRHALGHSTNSWKRTSLRPSRIPLLGLGYS